MVSCRSKVLDQELDYGLLRLFYSGVTLLR